MAAFLTLFVCGTLITSVFGADQPNIIFLMCDSMDGRNMDPTAAQFPLMSMPNLRSLAAKGTTLTRHYASSPQCVPGRTTLFSGRRIDESGGYNNGMGWGLTSDGAAVDPQCASYYNEDTCRRFANVQKFNATLFDAMTDIGYDVFLIGKVDVGAGIIESGNAHFDAQTNGTADGFHTGPGTNSGLTIETRSANIQRATKGTPVADETDNNVHHEDFEIVAKCIDKLNDLKSTESEASKPWFLYCSINIPHPPYQTNATWLSGVDVGDIPLPQWLPEAQFHPADAYQSISKSVWGNFSDAAIQSVRATYYAMNVETDYLLGSVLNASYALGWDTQNTLFVFTSDHGDMNMEHRQQLKNSMYEGSARIPLFFAGPNVAADKIIANITATIDVLPTLIALGGGGTVSADYNFSGVSVFDPSHPPFVTSQYHSNMGNTGSFMVRKAQWKYVQFGHFLDAFAEYAPQLFDVEADPEELKDVSGDPQNADVLSELEAILANEFNYEYVDCVAKFNDFVLFEEFQWLRFNESTLKTRLGEAYAGFDDADWQTIVDWRLHMLNVTNATCEEHAEQWLRPVREEERRDWFVDVKTLVKSE